MMSAASNNDACSLRHAVDKVHARLTLVTHASNVAGENGAFMRFNWLVSTQRTNGTVMPQRSCQVQVLRTCC